MFCVSQKLFVSIFFCLEVSNFCSDFCLKQFSIYTEFSTSCSILIGPRRVPKRWIQFYQSTSLPNLVTANFRNFRKTDSCWFSNFPILKVLWFYFFVLILVILSFFPGCFRTSKTSLFIRINSILSMTMSCARGSIPMRKFRSKVSEIYILLFDLQLLDILFHFFTSWSRHNA